MKKTIWAFFLTLALLLPLAAVPAYAAEDAVTDYGTSGSIGEEERAPENDDHSNWLTIRAGDYGVRIVAQDGRELIAADNFGGVYLDGDVYLNQELLSEKLQEREPDRVANGFFYFLLVISIVMNIYCIVKIRKQR